MNALSIFSSAWFAKFFSLLGVPTFDDGTGKQVVYKVQTLDIMGSGSYTGGTLKISRFGNQTTITVLTDMTHASLSSVLSAVGFIPSWARPSSNKAALYNLSSSGSGEVYRVDVYTDGKIGTAYFNNTFSVFSRISSTVQLTISYNI